MSHARSILLAGLLVLSTVVTGVGPALAQTTETATDSGPVTKTFETGPHKVKIDLFDVSSETTITVITDESPAGDNTAILKKTVSGSQNSAHFRNAGAYESFTVKVEGIDGPVSMSKGGVTNAWKPGDDGRFLGDTGGDPGFTYDLSEQIGESVMPQVVQLDRAGLPSSTTVNTTGTDATQTKLDIYQSAQNQRASADNYQTSLSNNLQGSRTQARVLGKNAYIRALNNGSSKAAAKTAAKEAVDQFYATKQKQLLNEWNLQVQNHRYLDSVAQNESGITARSYTRQPNESSNFADPYYDESSDYLEVTYPGTTGSVTLVNGDTESIAQIKGTAYNNNNNYKVSGTGDFRNGKLVLDSSNNLYYYGVIQPGYDADASSFEAISLPAYSTRWLAIQTQASTVRNDMDTLAENTYSAYQNGEINNTDLVDPYVLANQQSAGENFQGWTAAQLTLLGTNSPENFDQIGSFNVTTESGTQYEGVLFSQENPASGQFENGMTYNTSNIGGTQYVVTSDRIVELDGEFTIDSISTQDGQTVQNVTIQKTTYETTNVTELKQQYEDLARKRAEIEAREQNLRGSAGGGLLGGSSSSLVLVLIGVGALYAVSQRRTGGNN
jgi:hypothetical protein